MKQKYKRERKQQTSVIQQRNNESHIYNFRFSYSHIKKTKKEQVKLI